MLSAAPIAIPAEAADEARTYLRIVNHDEDALLCGLLASATALCEQFTGQALLARAHVETLAGATGWARLTATPVKAIEGVAALHGGEALLLPVDAYAVDIDAGGDGWVRMAGGAARRVRVTYRAGIAEQWTALPEALRHGIVRLAGHFHTHRDRPEGEAPPAAVTALWRPWRRMRIG